ncbi:alcohol dehydrogenase catalytic domain-containing protein [uncultured Oscillibacter sp.]|uniref:zinc-dependent alcohol dehydrogenase n=1 Tax=uncultured Oscillibacter sp. TaxID=876091 RepID=UPI0025F52DA3|nr:alcohol dehydrogenase catalytic domain-containing protein [uncultured Oscillibacter sp.]
MMRAVVYEQGGRAHAGIRDVPEPVCGDGQVLVRVLACGICKPADSGHDRGTSMLGRYPVIPGHEFAGVVEQVGKDITRFRLGDRVAVDNGAPCWVCYYCRRGEFAFCENYKAMGQSLNGGFAQLAVAPESHVYAVPEGVSIRAAALSELVGCAYHCIDNAQIPQAGDVLILGCGASGMLLAMLAKSTAAGTVTAVDLDPGKLERIAAKGVGTVLVERGNYGALEALQKERFPHGFDVVIDATGDAELIERSLPLLKAKGRFLNYSFASTDRKSVSVDMSLFARKELHYMGSTFQHHNFDQVLRSMAKGRVDPEYIVTHVYPLENYFEALDKNLSDSGVVKVLIEPNGSSDGK